MTPNRFIAKWRLSELKEHSASQEHFLDLCRLLGEPTPAEDDPRGERYCFERGARKDYTTIGSQRSVRSASPGKSKCPGPYCQPNAEDLRQDSRHKGTFEDAIEALVAPVRICRVMPRKRRR